MEAYEVIELKLYENNEATLELKAFQPAIFSGVDLGKDSGATTKPETSEHIFSQRFRLLSAVALEHYGRVIDFREANWKKTPSLVEGAPLLKDHMKRIDECIGNVKNAKYNSTSTPPGLDADLCVDKRLDKDTALRLEEKYIQCCSCGIRYKWKKSHETMSDWDFWNKMGAKVEGKTVRMIVTEIIAIPEVSVVWRGADKTARSFSDQEGKNKNTDLGSGEKNSRGREESMLNEITLDLIARLSGKAKSTLLEEAGLGAALGIIEKKLELITQEKETADARLKELQEIAEFRDQVMKKKRDRAETLAKSVYGTVKDKDGKDVLRVRDQKAIDHSTFEELEEMTRQLETELAEKAPAVCPKCQTQVELRSSVPDDPMPVQSQKKRRKVTSGV